MLLGLLLSTGDGRHALWALAKQYDLSSFLDTLMDFLFCVVFLGIVFAHFVPSRQHVNRRCLISVVLYRNKL